MEHIGYTTTLIYNDCGELEGECSEIKSEPMPYTNIEYVKKMKSLQWIDFKELHYNISPRTGRPDTLNAIHKSLKRVYFGEVRNFGSLESFCYFFGRDVINNLKPEEQADKCKECGACEKVCPQQLSIREHLKQVAETLGNL